MDDSIEVYITSDYSVKLDRVDILFIADDVRLALYEMPPLMIILLLIF